MDILKALRSNHSRYLYFLLGCCIVLAFYHFHSGLGLINPKNINWLIDNVELSNGFYVFGFFREQPWRFPIGTLDNYFFPLGVNVAHCDIPLMALFFKPFSGLLPEPFQYVGIWYLLSHVLQAWFSILLCERFNIKGFQKVAFMVFMLFSPVLLSRGIHPALFCQWMILAAIWIYFLDPGKTPTRKIILYQSILFIVSGLTFAYMWAMVFGFTVALFFRLWVIDKKLSFIGTLTATVSLHVVMVGLWLVIGLISFGGGDDFRAMGWGAFSLNINSLVNPMGTGSVLPTLPYFINQQLEGYNYLGAGILFLIVFCIVFSLLAKRFPQLYLRSGKGITMAGVHVLPLLVFLVFSTIYALSSRVSFNQTLIFIYPIPKIFEGIVNSFRSSGRLFWPVYYFLIVVTLYYYNRLNFNGVIKQFILGGCLMLQLYDIQYFFSPVTINYSDEYVSPLNNKVWDKVIGSFDVTFFYPGFRRDFRTADDYRLFAYHSVLHKKKINMGYVPRFNASLAGAVMGKEGARVSSNLGLRENYLYITAEPYLNRLIVPLAASDGYCFNIDGYLAIFKKRKETEELAEFIRQNGGRDVTRELAKNAHLSPWLSQPDSVTSYAKVGFYETDGSENHFFVKGWSFLRGSANPGNDTVRIVIESSRTKRRWISLAAYRFGTQDVADFFNDQRFDAVGFGASIDTENLPNESYQMGLLFTDQNKMKKLFMVDHHIYIDRPAALNPVQIGMIAGTVRFDINKVQDEDDDVVLEGWAFPEHGTCARCKAYFILRNDSITLEAVAPVYPREDVVSFFKDSTLVNTGIRTKLRRSKSLSGLFRIGILFKDTVSGRGYYSDTDKDIRMGLGKFSLPVKIATIPAGKDSVRESMDAMEESEDFVRVEGWAFVDGLPATQSKVSIFLTSEENIYKFDAHIIRRPDVQEFFNTNYDVTMAGYKVLFLRKGIESGKYRVCVVIKNTTSGVETLIETDRFIKI